MRGSKNRSKTGQAFIFSNRCGLNFFGIFSQRGHLDRGDCRFGALVAVDAAAAVDGLLLVVVGEQAEDHRNIGLYVQVFDALGNAFTDEFKMHGLAFDDTANCDHYIDLPGHDHALGTVNEFKTAGYIPAGNVLGVGATIQERGLTAFVESFGNVVVPL